MTSPYVPLGSQNNLPPLKAISMEEFLLSTLPERDYLLHPVIPEQGIVMGHRQNLYGVAHVPVCGWWVVPVQLACSQGSARFVCGWRNASYLHARAPSSFGHGHGSTAPCDAEFFHYHPRHPIAAHAGLGNNLRAAGS